MSLRSIASLTLSFGLVAIPVKLYSASESAAALRFKWMSRGGASLRQRYVADALPAGGDEDALERGPEPTPARRATAQPVARAAALHAPDRVTAEEAKAPPLPQPLEVDHTAVGDEVERDEMAKGYEYEKGKFVLFTLAELDALRAAARESIDIVAFIPIGAVDPIYYDKAYLLGPGRRGERSYSLLLHALSRSHRSALAKWAWKGKEYAVQIRPADGGLVLQQLLYADEVRVPSMLGIDLIDPGETELKLAMQLIEQGARHAYDPTEFVDEEKQRILDAVQQKIAGRKTVVHSRSKALPSAEVVDLLDALRASLQPAAHPKPLPARKPVVRARQKIDVAASARRRGPSRTR